MFGESVIVNSYYHIAELTENLEGEVLLIAGEASGDMHGAELIRAIKNKSPNLRFSGIGGEKMAMEGMNIMLHASEMAVIGLSEVLKKLPIVFKAYRIIKNQLKNNTPALCILIDYPGFNLYIAKIATRFKIPVFYYIAPQVWAWRSGRAKKISKYVNRMAVILPFEKDFFKRYGVNVDYVGHPLADDVNKVCLSNLNIADIKQSLGISESKKPVLALIPGSRNQEVNSLLPIMIEAAEYLQKNKYPELVCLLPLAPTIEKDTVLDIIQKSSVKIIVWEKDIYSLLKLCDGAIAASGTVTLQIAMMNIPMVLVYKVFPITYYVARMIIKTPYIGLVNLIAEKKIVPELIQHDATSINIANCIIQYLEENEPRRKMIANFARVRDLIGKPGAAENAADIALSMLLRNKIS